VCVCVCVCVCAVVVAVSVDGTLGLEHARKVLYQSLLPALGSLVLYLCPIVVELFAFSLQQLSRSRQEST
jgi:hypothetical protein